MKTTIGRLNLRPSRGLLARTIGLGAAVSILAVSVAAPALAHVIVDSTSHATEGGYGIVRLTVPTESKTARTVGVTVTLPDGVDLGSARTLPVPGWTATVETEPAGTAERVTKITWRADGEANGLAFTEYGEFAFSAGRWPTDVGTVVLATDQAYSDGTTVSWSEVALDAASEPDHPAPILTLGAATADDHGHHDSGVQAAGPDTTDDHALASATSEDTSNNWVWRTISLVSLAVAVGAAAFVVLARRGGA